LRLARHTGSWAADSPDAGTGLRPEPCAAGCEWPDPPPNDRRVAVTLSGGGFRATLAGAGALRLLSDVGLLGDIGYLSSVSGGSITNGLTALVWGDLRAAGFTTDAFDECVVEPLVRAISTRSLKWRLLAGAWQTLGSATRTDLLAHHLEEWFFENAALEDLDQGVRWIWSAANLVTGVRFGFEGPVLGDYVIGLVPTAGSGVRLSRAVAASCAVPGTFAPVVLDDVDFPCAKEPPVLVDGGVYDNTGLEALDGESYRQTFLCTMNAGGLLHPGYAGTIPIVRDLIRANALLYRQSTSLRTRDMVSRFKRAGSVTDELCPEGSRRGVLVALATDFTEPRGRIAEWRSAHPEVRTYGGRDLALMPTVLDKLDERLCRALVYRGWWLMGAALATYYPDHLGALDLSEPPL
jgi:NTE family protein